MPQTVFTPSRCHIDLAAIARNFEHLGNPARLMPVIKSDAYGHGLLPVAGALAKAQRFAVGIASEGAALREAGFGQDIILLMGCQTTADWQLAAKYDLTPIVGSREDVHAAAAVATPARPLRVAIKCDSGMGRLGFRAGDAEAVGQLLRSLPSLVPVMAISHLACADMPACEEYSRAQIERFAAFHARLAAFFPQLARSLGNSAGTLGQVEDDISRPGLALYGGNPFGPEACGLDWAMSVASPIIHIHHLKPGESVSYGSIFTATAPMRVAVAACGYATGFARALSGRVQLLVHGRRVPQIGRVCMGMIMLDVSQIPDAAPGDCAWILGGEAAPGEQPVDAWELAQLLDTIPYEVLCLLGGLNPRVYA